MQPGREPGWAGTRSQTYIIVKVGRDLLRSSSSAPCSKPGQSEQVPQGGVHLGFEYLKDEDSETSLSNLFRFHKVKREQNKPNLTCAHCLSCSHWSPLRTAWLHFVYCLTSSVSTPATFACLPAHKGVPFLSLENIEQLSLTPLVFKTISQGRASLLSSSPGLWSCFLPCLSLSGSWSPPLQGPCIQAVQSFHTPDLFFLFCMYQIHQIISRQWLVNHFCLEVVKNALQKHPGLLVSS